MPIISGEGGGGGLGPANAITGDAAAGIPLDILGGVGQAGADFATLLRVLDSSTNYGLTLDSSGSLVVNADGADGADINLQVAGGTALGLRLRKDEVIWRGYTVAPIDSHLSGGYFALWLDQTDGVGNTKLMVKAKSADGTVRTAAIVLT